MQISPAGMQSIMRSRGKSIQSQTINRLLIVFNVFNDINRIRPNAGVDFLEILSEGYKNKSALRSARHGRVSRLG